MQFRLWRAAAFVSSPIHLFHCGFYEHWPTSRSHEAEDRYSPGGSIVLDSFESSSISNLIIKATFHYSSQLQTGRKPGFRPGLQPGFRQVRAGLRHAFDTLSTFFVENLVANLLHQSQYVEIDAAGLQQVRWFVRVLDKWNVEKPVSSQLTNLLQLDFCDVFYYSCLSWRN